MEDERVKRECDISSFIMFESRLNSSDCLTPEGWKQCLSFIRSAVFVLTKYSDCKIIDTVVNSLCIISNACVFQSFLSFCKSKSCDSEARSTAKSLFLLYSRSLQEVSEQPHGRKLSEELRKRIENSSDLNSPLLTDDDIDLFNQIFKVVSPIAFSEE